MYRDNAVGVVVTAYQEAEFVGSVVEEVPDYVDYVYAVDDGSTDGTWEAIQRAANAREVVVRPDGGTVEADAEAPESGTTTVVPIRHRYNSGAGAATKTGYRRALEDGLDVVAVVNGDGQMDTGILHRFLDPIVEGRADFAKGTRLSTQKHREGMTRWRLFGNVLLTGLTRVATGYWGLSDAQNGYTAISAETLSKLDLDALYDRHGFLNDLIAQLSTVEARIADVPHPAVYGDEESSISYGQFVPGLSALLARRFLGRVGRGLGKPLFWPAPLGYAAGVLAILAGIVGTVSGGGPPLVPSSSPLVAMFLGVTCLLAGLAWDAGSVRLRGRSRVTVERGDPA